MDKSSLNGLRVALDAKRALNNTTGLGNYSRCLLEALASAAGTDGGQVLLMSAANPDTHRIEALLRNPAVKLCVGQGFAARRLKSLWRSRGMVGDLRRLRPDVYHGLSNELPLNIARAGVPSVVTIHDVIWRRFPTDYSAIDRRLYDLKYGSSARNATRVIAISECTARDLVSDFGIPRDKIDVVYQDCHPQFRPANAEDIARVRRDLGLGDAPYAVTVGTVQGRKNQLLAVKGLLDARRELKLVIVGRRTDYARQIDEFITAHPELAERVIWPKDVPFAELPALYSGAVFSSYTSRYEGFGLPVVESLRCATPVIAATGSCLEEAGGPGAFYVDPDDADAWANAANRFLDDSDLRSRMAAQGMEYSRRFGASFLSGTIESYRKAIAQYSPV